MAFSRNCLAALDFPADISTRDFWAPTLQMGVFHLILLHSSPSCLVGGHCSWLAVGKLFCLGLPILCPRGCSSLLTCKFLAATFARRADTQLLPSSSITRGLPWTFAVFCCFPSSSRAGRAQQAFTLLTHSSTCPQPFPFL